MWDARGGVSTVAEYVAHEFGWPTNSSNARRSTPDAARKSVEAERARADGERLLKPFKRLMSCGTTVRSPEF
jgi:hypothetical protein